MIDHEIRIREAQEADVPVLADFNRRMARETEGRELDPAVLASGVQAVFTEPGRGFYLVAEITAAVVGCLLVTKEWSDWRDGEFWWIQSVYVARDFRGRGVFRALYQTVRKRAENADRVCGCRLYVEQENHAAQAVYARMGLVETSYKVFEELLS